jgi:hypothetical protein
VDGYGVTRHHVPVRESAWRTTKTFANSPLAQAIPIVGDIADGVNAVDYATKGDYLPAAMAVGMGLLTPDSAEVGYKMVDGDDYAARVIRERQQKAAEEAAERQAIAKSSKNQYKRGARGRFSKESLDHDSPHISNIPKNRDYSGSLDQNAHDLFTGQDYVDMHKNGGFMNCLRNGGSISKCKCGCSKIEKAGSGNPELGKYHLRLSNGNNYGLSGYGSNPQRTVETLTTPEDVITRTIERGDTTVTRNGQPFVPTMRFHQNFDEMKEKAILAKDGQDYLDYRKRTGTFDEGGKVRGGN